MSGELTKSDSGKRLRSDDDSEPDQSLADILSEIKTTIASANADLENRVIGEPNGDPGQAKGGPKG